MAKCWWCDAEIPNGERLCGSCKVMQGPFYITFNDGGDMMVRDTLPFDTIAEALGEVERIEQELGGPYSRAATMAMYNICHTDELDDFEPW